MESFLIEMIFGNSLFDLKKNSLILSYAVIDYILPLITLTSFNNYHYLLLQKQSFNYPFRIL